MGFRVYTQTSETCPRKNIKWNNQIYDWLIERMNRTKEPVTYVGPPRCEDRPWWWGRSESEK